MFLKTFKSDKLNFFIYGDIENGCKYFESMYEKWLKMGLKIAFQDNLCP